MAVTFNGADLTVRFKEQSTNGAELQYQLEYQCGSGSITHYVDASKPQSTDADGLRVYKDTLTYAENTSAGLTRSPRVRMRTQAASGKWSTWRDVDAQNPIPVLAAAPVVTPTLDGVEIALKTPVDGDFEGFVAWVAQSSTVPLDAAHERYRGKANSFTLQLPDNDTYYLRVAPYDAFGLDLFSAWDAVAIKRADLDAAVKQTGTVQDIIAQTDDAEALASAAKTEVATARSEIADAKTQLGQAVTDARSVADAARTDAANASNAATQVRTDLEPTIAAAKAEGTTARSEAKKASDDLAAEVTRAKGAEGTLTTKVGVAQSRADGAMIAISDETTQRIDSDASLGQRIDTVVAKANTDRGTFNTKISDEATTRADQDTAISHRLGVVEANYVTADDATEIANAKVSDEATTRATRDAALSGRITSIEANYVSEDRAFGFTTSEVQNEATARANAIGAVGQRIDGVIAQATTDRSDYTAKIRSEETARAAVDQALSDKVDVVEAKLRGDQDSGLAAQVRTEAAARVSGDTATATRTDSLEATRDYQRGLLSNNDLSPEARKSYGMDAPGSSLVVYESNHGQVGWVCRVKDANYIYFHNNHKIIKQAGRRIRATCWFYSNTANARARIYWNDNNDVEGRYRGEGESGGSIGINGVVGVTGVWTKITSEITITDDWRQNIYAIFNADPANGATQVGGDFYVSGMIIEDVTEVTAANARITDLATVTSNADGALAQRIQTVEANYVTNAQADAKVNAEAVTRAGETGALSSRIGSVETRYSGSGNLLGNTEFVTAAGWNVTHNGMAMGALVTQAGDYWDPRGETTLTMSRAGQPGGGTFTEVQSAPFALEPNTFIQFYGRTASHRSRSWISLFFRDENGNDAGYAGENFGARIDSGGPDLSGWDYTGKQSIRVPGNARSALFVWRVYDNGQSDPIGWLFHPYVGQAREGQTEWNPYSPGSGKQSFVATNARIEDVNTASANRDSAMGQRVDTTEAKLRGDQDSGILAAVRDETNTRVTQASGLSTRIGVVESKSRNVATSYTAVSRGNGAVAKFGRGAGIYNVDGANFTGGGRGYRVNVFDSNNTLIASNLYDTLAGDRGFSSGGAPEMASFLNGITEGQAVIITTDDEPQSNRLSSGLVEAMERCGAGPLFTGNTFKYRGAYILVGQAGIGKGNGNEYYSGSVDSGPDAWIEARFDLLAGRPQLNGSGKAISETNAAIKDEVAARTTAVDAVSSRTATIEASYTAGGNMLSNTDFAYNEAGWNYAQEAATGSGRDAITGTNWWPVGMHPLVMGQENGSTNRGGFWWQDVHGIEIGQTYQASMFTASHRCDTQVYIDCFNSAGAVIANFTSPYSGTANNDNNAPLSNWARPYVNFVVPTGTSYIRFYLMKWGTYAGQANSYAWFLRPQLVHTRSGVTALVPYTPGSGNSANAATNARVDSEATTRANADAAQSGRISTTEAQLNGTQGSWMSGRITDVETASVNRDNAITSRTSTLESVALGGGSSARNDNFAFWKDGNQYPENWITWQQEGNWRTERQQGIAGSPYCVRTLNDYANVESGFYQQVFVYPGKWIVEVTAESDPSGFSGAGMTLHGQFNIDFLGDADTNNFTGDKVNAVRTWTKAFDFSQDFVNSIGGIVNFHAMHGWTGFNRYRAPKYMRWHKMSLRPADYGGAEAFRANARITEEANTRSTAISSLASKTSTLEVAMARGEYLNRNALFNEPWDGNGLPPGWGIWSQEGGGYYGRWPSGSGLYGPNALQWDRQGGNSGFWQQLNGQYPVGWYVLDCEVRLEDGATPGSGFHANFMNGYSSELNFYSEQDANEQTGQRGNGNYKFSKLIYNGAVSTQINLHPMPGWYSLGGYSGFLRTIWFKAGIRPASVQEVKAGKVDNLSARVSTNESAVANLNGKTQAYFSKSVAVPGAEAFIMANAINDAGQATSNVAIGGTNIALYNTQDGTAKRAMYLLAGNATFDGMITARTGIRIGDGTWQVAVSPKDFRVSNGTVVNYGYDLGRVPNITFGPCPVSLNAGEVYQAYAENSTSTGFTARLVIQGSPTAASQSTGAGYSYNGNQGYQADKGGPDATNGTYTINASGTFTAQAYYDGSGDCVHIDAWTSQDKQAGDVQQGDLILILNEDGSYYEEQHVQNNYIASAHCVRITTASGIQLTLSDSTPVTLRDLSVVNVREVVGQELAVLDEGDFRWETVTTLEEIGLQPVAHISALDGTYAAGDVKGRMIFTHNIYYKP